MKKILIIEDERTLSRALELKLTHEGFEVEILSNGEEFLNKIETGEIALVICDLIMPKIDGFEILSDIEVILTTRARAITPKTIIAGKIRIPFFLLIFIYIIYKYLLFFTIKLTVWVSVPSVPRSIVV